jgi:hypothetical protein
MRRLRGIIPIAAIGLAFAWRALAADMVVLDSTSPGLRAGQVVASDGKLGLAAGQTVTLMTSSGKMVRVAGPADSIPAGDAGTKGDEKTVLASLTTMVKSRQADTGSLGTFRSAGAELPDPWLIDVSGSGERCVLEGEPMVLWRPDGGTAAAVVMGLPAKDWRARAEWPAGSQRLFGPAGLGLADGDVLSVSFEARQADLTVHLVPAAVQGEAMRLTWLVERNCMAQAAALVRQLE